MSQSAPRNYVSSILDATVTLKEVSPDLAQWLQTQGGQQAQVRGETVWTVRLPDDQALAALLAELRDREVLFAGAAAGWSPADIFDDLRARRLLSGPYQEVVWRGAGVWSTRTR
jgi:hypothetical protein